MYDENGDGYISRDELARMLVILCPPEQSQGLWHADSVFVSMDTDGDGRISYDEFKVCAIVCDCVCMILRFVFLAKSCVRVYLWLCLSRVCAYVSPRRVKAGIARDGQLASMFLSPMTPRPSGHPSPFPPSPRTASDSTATASPALTPMLMPVQAAAVGLSVPVSEGGPLSKPAALKRPREEEEE